MTITTCRIFKANAASAFSARQRLNQRLNLTRLPPRGAPERIQGSASSDRANHRKGRSMQVISSDRTPTHGYGATREAAMAAFAESWRAG
jgi:hypothetical protein